MQNPCLSVPVALQSIYASLEEYQLWLVMGHQVG